ncbi:DUF4360 domain-containing protein [Actinomadura roseirufa]|uniref:DUF4360 domain-containing protein n=1 Tax=Actinomadura roseirufa TaxID=2094049 RepID=UPI00104197CF
MAQVDAGSKPTDFRKNCQFSVNVHVPRGFPYARGFPISRRPRTGCRALATTIGGSSTW